MSRGEVLAETRVALEAEGLKAYVREHLGGGLRRAGLSAEFLVASAVSCWKRAQPPPREPRLALVWANATGLGPETAGLLEGLLERREGPMPFQFIANQPHMAALHAGVFLPGLVHAAALIGQPEDLEAAYLGPLAAQEGWTHVLLGAVATPGTLQEPGALFTARWRLLAVRPGGLPG